MLKITSIFLFLFILVVGHVFFNVIGTCATDFEVVSETMSYLILWQTGKRFNDGSQGHLALFGQINSAG